MDKHSFLVVETIILAQLFAYVPNFAWLAFYTACFVLAIVFFSRTKRKPFVVLSISFVLVVAYHVYYLLINGMFFVGDLIASGMSPSEASILALYYISIPTWILNAFHALLLLGATIMFFKETREK